MAFTGKEGSSALPDAQSAGAAAAQLPRRTDSLIQHSANLADELRGLNYRLTAFVQAMVTAQPANPIGADTAEVATLDVKRPALEQIDSNLEQIREQVTKLSLTIGEAEQL